MSPDPSKDPSPSHDLNLTQVQVSSLPELPRSFVAVSSRQVSSLVSNQVLGQGSNLCKLPITQVQFSNFLSLYGVMSPSSQVQVKSQVSIFFKSKPVEASAAKVSLGEICSKSPSKQIHSFLLAQHTVGASQVRNSPSSTLTHSAESKQARMFVILLTAQESGGVILGMLIDSRGKVCLRLLTQGKWTNTADSSQLKHKDKSLMYTRAG